MPSIAEQRARIAELASRMIAKNPGNAGAIMQQLKDAGLDISGNPIGAPAAQGGGGFPLPRVPPASGISYTGLMSGADLGPLAKYAGRTPAPPPTGLSPDEMALPFNGTGGDPNSLRSMADRGDPSQAPDFRSRLNAAMDTAGVQLPGPRFSTQGVRPDLSGYDRSSPSAFRGNLPRTRPPEQLSPGGSPPSMAGLGPSSPLTGATPPSPLAGVGPPAPIIGREAPPGLNGPPSPLASRFGDQSQLPGGAFSGSLPRPPQPRPFESTIAARPMPPGGPGSLPAAPAAPVLAGQPFTGPPGMASRFGDQSQLAGGAFTGGSAGPPPPLATGPTPLQLDATKDMVRQMASLPSVPSPRSLQPIETTPTSTMPNPLQRAPLDLAAGVGAPKLPLGSISMPFAGIPPTPASVAQRTGDVLGPLPPGAGTGAPVRSVQQPLIGVPPASGTVPPVGPVPGQDLPAPPPAGTPTMIASIPPASLQSVGLDQALALSGTAPPPAITPTRSMPGYKPPDLSRISPKEQEKRARERGFGSLENSPRDRWGRAIGATVGGLVGAFTGGPGGAVTLGTTGYKLGDNAARGIANLTRALRGRGQKIDAQGNILDKTGNIIGHISDKLGGIFGNSGSSLSGGNWTGRGGSQYGGGFGGGGGYGGGGTYGGSGGSNIGLGVGGAFRNR